jgi:peptidoglycan/LPS O-acetylase OafA/YrhL
MSSKLPGGLHMPQLDGLRTLAVAAVIWSHWVPPYQFGFEWGVMGVNLFFVLSGFLITGILLDSRAGAVRSGDRWFAIRQFYTRRVLRIFPLFYMTLALLVLVNVRPVRQTFLWHVCYLSNVYFFRQGAWIGQISHFWSLAVEEQFYGVAVFDDFSPSPVAASGGVGVDRAGAVVPGGDGGGGSGEPTGLRADDRVLGRAGNRRLVGIFGTQRRRLTMEGGGVARWLLWIGLPAWAAVEVLNRLHLAPGPLLTLRQTFLDMIFGWVVLRGARGFKGWFGRFLQWPPMAYLGKISYGLYVFHNLTVYGLVFAVRNLHAPAVILSVPWLQCLTLLVLTISAAAVSWHFFEKPLNDLKRFFPYHAPARASQPAAEEKI